VEHFCVSHPFGGFIVSGASVNFTCTPLPPFSPHFLGRIHGLSPRLVRGSASCFVYLSEGSLSADRLAILGDSIIRRRRDGRLRIAAMTALAAALSRVTACCIRAARCYTTICLTLAYAFSTPYYGLVSSAIQDLVAPDQRGATMLSTSGHVHVWRFPSGAAHRPAQRFPGTPRRRPRRLATVHESFRAIGLQQAL